MTKMMEKLQTLVEEIVDAQEQQEQQPKEETKEWSFAETLKAIVEREG